MNTTLVSTTLLLITLGAAGARDEQRPQGPPPDPILVALDANRDHLLDEDEIEAAPEVLREIDANDDDQLTRDELRPQPPSGEDRESPPEAPEDGADERPAGRPPVPPLITVLDANGDGTIDADEIDRAAESIRILDQDGDGEVSEEEFRPQSPQREGGGQQPGGGEQESGMDERRPPHPPRRGMGPPPGGPRGPRR